MGILDAIVNNWGQWSDDPRKNQANDAYINALAAGLLSGRSNNFGVNLGRAMGGAQGALGEERDRIAKQGLIDAQVGHYGNQRKLIDAQVGHYKTQDDQLRNNLALAQRRAAILAQVGGAPGPETMPAPQGGMDVGVFPSAPRSQPGFSQQQIAEFLAAGGNRDDIKALIESKDWGRPEVAGTIETTNAQRQPVSFMRDKFGNIVGEARPKAYEMRRYDAGGTSNAEDPYNLQQVASTPKTMTPGEAASNGIARANLGLRREELDWNKANPAQTYDAERGGLVNTRTGAFQPVMSAEGKPIGPKERPMGETPLKQIAGVKNLGSAVDEYVKAMKSWTLKDAGDLNKRAAMGTVYNNMMLQAKEAYNLGVLNGPDYSILTAIVTDPTSLKGAFISNDALSKQASELKRIIGSVEGGIREAHGKSPIQSPADTSTILKDAKNAMLKGAPRDAVVKRLESMGITDHGL